jgi:glycosyltransferase involved in cell wall biosynthesis
LAVSRRTISVIIPAYNEARNLEAAVNTVIEAAGTFDDFEVLIVNDGSTDDTGEVAERLAAADPRLRVVHHGSNQGFAAAYGSGLARARMQYVTFAPGDNEIVGASLAEIFDAVGKADLVVPYHGTPWKRAFYRRILTWTCVTQINAFFGWHLHYFQGPTVYPTDVARVLPRTTRGFFFITEMLVYALAAGYTAVEVPLIHQERAYGRSNAVGLSKIVDAERTILHLWWQIRLLGRRVPVVPVVQDEVLQRV